MSQRNDNQQEQEITVKWLLTKYFKDESGKSKTFDDLLKLPPKDSTTEEDKALNKELVPLIIKGAEKMMEEHAFRITYTQLRKVMATVKDKKFETDYTGLFRAIPKLAYMQGRPQKKEGGDKIIGFIRELAGKVSDNNEYKAFEEIVNALVAYHKVYG